jgi:c-di-AMP phosphodiesterase-like protein
MCTVLFPPGVIPIAVNKYIISCIIVSYISSYRISYIIYRIISYHFIIYIAHIIYHISYHIIHHISYISYHISYNIDLVLYHLHLPIARKNNIRTGYIVSYTSYIGTGCGRHRIVSNSGELRTNYGFLTSVKICQPSGCQCLERETVP